MIRFNNGNKKFKTPLMVLILILLSAMAILVVFKLVSRPAFFDSSENQAVLLNTWKAKQSIKTAKFDIYKAFMKVKTDIHSFSLHEKDELSALKETFPVIRINFKGDVGLVDRAESLLDKAILSRNQVFELAACGNQDKAYQIVKRNYLPALEQISEIMEQIALKTEGSAIVIFDLGKSTSLLISLLSGLFDFTSLGLWCLYLFSAAQGS